MNHPLVSICIPTYNGEKFLSTCIESAINQSYNNIEIIIVDDVSTDNTYEITRNYAAKDSRIKIFRNEKNLGLVGNWNRCIELSSGEWIKFLFQDDYFDTNCIEVLVSSILADYKMVVSQRRYVSGESGKEIIPESALTFEKLGIRSTDSLFIGPEKIASLAVQHICLNFIGEPTVVMFKKSLIKELGIFNPDLIQICDLEYFLRIASNYGLKYIPQQLTYFRLHNDSASAANILKRFFLINNTDPIITVHELLYGNHFQRFRKTLSLSQKIKLKLFFTVRVYEANQAAIHSTVENRNTFDSIANKYPFISALKKGNMVTNLLLRLTLARRSFRKANNR